MVATASEADCLGSIRPVRLLLLGVASGRALAAAGRPPPSTVWRPGLPALRRRRRLPTHLLPARPAESPSTHRCREAT